jgi:Xaa-Pro aminopeptidase
MTTSTRKSNQKLNKDRDSFDAELIISDSEKDPNMLYAAGLFAPDPFIFFKTSHGSAVVMSDLEYGRALKQARVDTVYSLSKILEDVKGQSKGKAGKSDLAEAVAWLLKKANVKSILVPEDFPVQYADPLRKIFKVNFKKEPFFEKRAIKGDWEVECIKRSVRAAEKGFAAALKILQDSSIGDNRTLYYKGKILRAEDLQREINTTATSLGCAINHTIVACGQHGVNPHNKGSGPLKAHETIIVDIFPRSCKTGYFGDFTRTVVKGKAKERVRKAYRLVKEGQDIAFEMIRDGVDGRDVHRAIFHHFEKNGFTRKEGKRGKEGFIHGTGHGLGLGLHEYPRIGEKSCVLQSGNTVTVEPGLYYRGMGGVRLEDVVVVKKKGCENLTRFPKALEIK